MIVLDLTDKEHVHHCRKGCPTRQHSGFEGREDEEKQVGGGNHESRRRYSGSSHGFMEGLGYHTGKFGLCAKYFALRKLMLLDWKLDSS
jgi:hypothetical protein